MKKVVKYIIIILIVLFVIYLIIQITGLSDKILDLSNKLLKMEKDSSNGLSGWQYIGLIVTILSMFILGFLGYLLAKKKGRNYKLWAILCFVFSIYALIILLCLPKRNDILIH